LIKEFYRYQNKGKNYKEEFEKERMFLMNVLKKN